MSVLQSLRRTLPSLTRSVHTSPPQSAVGAAVTALLHGSQTARDEGEHAEKQHSKTVGRGVSSTFASWVARKVEVEEIGTTFAKSLKHMEHVSRSNALYLGVVKYVHEFQRHSVLPQHVEQYKKLIAGYYAGIADSPEFDCRLTGSWEVTVGEVDTFVHIWEYEGMPGYERTKHAVRESKGHLQFFNHEILPLIQKRTSQLNQEFAFWKCAQPSAQGGIFELRTYGLKPGALLEWEHEWRVGLEARLASGHSPVGAWFAQVGRLHEVHHMWRYDSLEQRRQMREKAWEIDTWSGTVTKTVRLATHMDCSILQALPFSPIR